MILKYFKQTIIWIFDINIIVLPLFFISLKIQPIGDFQFHIIDFISRYILIQGIYQVLILVFNKNQLDARKDSLLSYITLLKELILYMETKDINLKKHLKDKINNLKSNKCMLHKDIRQAIELTEKFIELNQYSINQINCVKIELILAEHSYEADNLNWNNTLFLKHLK